MRLVLVRHGESEWNVERRIQGQSGTGLSTRGADQARRTAALLAEAYPDARLASSDLQRCRETVAPLADLLGVEVVWDEGLRERHFGAWTGRLASEVMEEERERWQRWGTGADVIGEVGGEATVAFTARVTESVHRLLDGADRPLICVTHGGPVWHGTHALVGLEPPAFAGVANASVTELDVDGDGRARLVSWNQIAHLPLELREVKRAESPRDDSPPVGT